MKRELLIIASFLGIAAAAKGGNMEAITFMPADSLLEEVTIVDIDTVPAQEDAEVELEMEETIAVTQHPTCPYFLPYSMTYSSGNWKRLWLNTSVLSGAFITTLGVLELLPEDATAWNRKEINSVPPFRRWYENVCWWGPEWDHDNAIFNYVLHPYAGAVYFMGARSCGFNFFQSMLYSAIISTVGWEFGIEAFMERPSYQDLFITPIVGSAIGEGFYIAKRKIVENDYRLLGSKVLGNIAAFIIDPVNEVIGLFAGNDCRHHQMKQQAEEKPAAAGNTAATVVHSSFWFNGNAGGIGIKCVF